MHAELLENLGLTKSEIKVYLCLLELNTSTASVIADKADLYRKNVYDALDRLAKRGLISMAKVEKLRMYSAVNPARLLEFIEIRKKEVQEILPELKRMYRAPPYAGDVTVFKGKEGLKTIFESILKAKTNYDKLGSEEKFKELLPYYYPQYQKRKRKNGIKSRAIHSENERRKEFVEGFLGKVRFLPKEFANPATTIICGNRVAIIVWKENPMGIVINSSEVAQSYKYYFDTLWASAIK